MTTESSTGKDSRIYSSYLHSIGEKAIRSYSDLFSFIPFVGEIALAFGRFLRGKAKIRASDFWLVFSQCGPEAVPIVVLVSSLVGLILSFIAAVQMRQFGAQIYVANLVGLAMVREMGCVMAAVIVAGRSGAAFAAQLGTMEVNEEIDALRTFVISPIDFLVLPRVLALSLALPLLCVIADVAGVVGGMVIGLGFLDISPALYLSQTISAVGVDDFLFGVVKSFAFGILVAIAGCLRGMTCGRDASAVGLAATSAVVTSIVLIVISDAIFAVLADILKI